jgi:hypothetical protein
MTCRHRCGRIVLNMKVRRSSHREGGTRFDLGCFDGRDGNGIRKAKAAGFRQRLCQLDGQHGGEFLGVQGGSFQRQHLHVVPLSFVGPIGEGQFRRRSRYHASRGFRFRMGLRQGIDNASERLLEVDSGIARRIQPVESPYIVGIGGQPLQCVMAQTPRKRTAMQDDASGDAKIVVDGLGIRVPRGSLNPRGSPNPGPPSEVQARRWGFPTSVERPMPRDSPSEPGQVGSSTWIASARAICSPHRNSSSVVPNSICWARVGCNGSVQWNSKGRASSLTSK